MRIFWVSVLLMACAAATLAQSREPKDTGNPKQAEPAPQIDPQLEELADHFNYDFGMALDLNEASVEEKGKAMLIELTYVGQNNDDHVPPIW